MKSLATLSTAFGIAVALGGLASTAQPDPGTAPSGVAGTAGSRVVRVYYFHTTQRCSSCRKIEALSEEAIREGFERELGDGRVEWRSVNLDDPPNRHFIGDYELYTKSLVVVDLQNGRQARWKNLPRIWELLRDETAFRQYVQREVHDYLEKRS